ncbi:cbb3-type cytochrome oxidase assembly protein CcoS [Niabella aquatica]
MSIIIITAIVSLFIAGIFLAALIWGIRDGQYDDDFAPPNRILFDDHKKTNNK